MIDKIILGIIIVIVSTIGIIWIYSTINKNAHWLDKTMDIILMIGYVFTFIIGILFILNFF